MAAASAGDWRTIPSDDAEHWRLCAEEMRVIAENMRAEDCRAMALRMAEGYERLARHAEHRAAHDEARGKVNRTA